MASTQISDLREEKKSLILRLFLGGGERTRRDIENVTGISYGTISIILRQLVAAGILRTVGKQSSQGGRRADTYQLEPQAAIFGQVSVTAAYMRWCIRDTHGDTLEAGAVPDDNARDANETLQRTVSMMLSAATTLGPGFLASIGVTVPGHYRGNQDRIVTAARERISELKIREIAHRTFDGPVHVESDVNAAALFEVGSLESEPPETETTIYLTVTADGVGATLLIDRSIHYGAAGHAGEVHMLPIQLGNATSRFGGLVDVEAVAKRIQEREGQDSPPDIHTLREMIMNSSSPTEEEYPVIVEAYAQALYLLDCVIDPHVVILAGPYVGFGRRFCEDIRTRIASFAESDLLENLTIRLAPNAEDLDQQGMWRMQATEWFTSLD